MVGNVYKLRRKGKTERESEKRRRKRRSRRGSNRRQREDSECREQMN